MGSTTSSAGPQRSNSRRCVREQESSDLFTASSGDRETAEVLERELRRLPPDQREVLILKFWGGLTFAQVAEAMRNH